jgi:hypothetical protein
MKLSELAAKPQLQELLIDDKDIVEKYGDSITFFVQDRLPLDTYVKLATIDQSNPGGMLEIMKDFILDEKGMPVLSDGNVLPMDVLNAAVVKVTDKLGK